MPFGSYQVSDEDAVSNAIRFVKEARADVVKLEGAGASLSRIRAIVDAGIPVMGHIGLTPQSATMLGGFRTQGRTAEKAQRLLDEARSLEAAGCFSIVLEAVPAPVAAEITRRLTIPTIGRRAARATVRVRNSISSIVTGTVVPSCPSSTIAAVSPTRTMSTPASSANRAPGAS
jgi:3-methyl-2-oxobutanoate hydroxymethyltransferase